jgi:hypothetical protein
MLRCAVMCCAPSSEAQQRATSAVEPVQNKQPAGCPPNLTCRLQGGYLSPVDSRALCVSMQER